MKQMRYGPTEKMVHLKTSWIRLMNTHKIHKEKPCPSDRSVADALLHAEELRKELPERVLPLGEDWDLVILADEINRLKNMI